MINSIKMNHDIFISYSRDDKKAVFPLINKINDELGTHCWVDLNGIESGEQFEDKIMGAIDASKIVLFLLSDKSLKSPWTKREVYYAEKHKKTIIPVVVDGDGLRGWFLFHFGSVDYIDIKSKDQCEKMIKDLKKWVNQDKEEILEKKPEDNKITNDNNHNTKNKLWIVLAAIVAVLVLLTVFLKKSPTDDNTIKEEETIVVQQESPDDVDFNNCKTIADYREYIAIYGRRGMHYKEAKQTIDEHLADSMAKAMEVLEPQTESQVKQMKVLEPQTEQTEEAKKRNGVFAVSSTKKVEFSKGNLQYQASTNTWRFAEHQWDMIGYGNKDISSSYNGWIDLFGWGTGNNPTKISKNSNDYSNFSDWGNNTICNGGNKKWFTLSKDEWVYMFDERSTNSGIRYSKAIVNDVSGVILLPDNWSSSYYSLSNTNNSDASFRSNLISQSDWISKLEANGAVFLPAAGYRYGTSVKDVGSYGFYWFATYYRRDGAYIVYFCNWELYAEGWHYRQNGRSVRLVCLAENY